MVKEQTAVFLDSSLATTSISYCPGTANFDPEFLLLSTRGCTPELSMACGGCQVTSLIFSLVVSVWLLGQNVNFGGSISINMKPETLHNCKLPWLAPPQRDREADIQSRRTETRNISRSSSERSRQTNKGTERDAGRGPTGHRGNKYLTSLPLDSVRRLGRVLMGFEIAIARRETAVSAGYVLYLIESRDKISLECNLYFPSAQLMLRQMHLSIWKYRG